MLSQALFLCYRVNTISTPMGRDCGCYILIAIMLIPSYAFIYCLKGHNGRAYLSKDVPPLQNI